MISQTAPGQELNVYASSEGGENFTLPMLAAVAAESEMIQDEVFEDDYEERAPTVLPSTAGQLGWLAIIGTLLVLLAGLVHAVRTRS